MSFEEEEENTILQLVGVASLQLWNPGLMQKPNTYILWASPVLHANHLPVNKWEVDTVEESIQIRMFEWWRRQRHKARPENTYFEADDDDDGEPDPVVHSSNGYCVGGKQDLLDFCKVWYLAIWQHFCKSDPNMLIEKALPLGIEVGKQIEVIVQQRRSLLSTDNDDDTAPPV
jgi:hypothetical protein